MKNWKPQLIFLILITLLILFKIKRFELLAYYIDDFSNNLEGTYSWLLGRPITYANGFGQMISAHNYFLMPVLGLVSIWAGIYGLFVLYSFFILLMWIKFNSIFPMNKLINIFLFVILFFNPTFLWIYDHPDTGFSMELFYLPFAGLFALALKSKNNLEAIFWATLLVLVREDGIILSCLIHLVAKAKEVDFEISKLFKTFIVPFLKWILLFFISIIFLHIKAEGQHTFIRLATVSLFEHLQESSFYISNAKIFIKAVILIIPFAGILFFLGKNNKNKFILFFFCNLVLLMLITFQGVKYYDLPFFEKISATWSIRFILPYSLALCFILLTIEQINLSNIKHKFTSVFVIIFLFFFQFYFIDRFRNDVNYEEIIKEVYRSKLHEGVSGYAEKSDVLKIRELENIIPKRSNIYIFDFISSIFSEHFVIWWNKGKAFENADIAVLPKDGYPHYTRDLSLYMKPNFKKVMDLKAYSIYATPEYKKIIESNLKQK